MRELTVEEREAKILSLEGIRDSCIASIEGLRSGNHKVFVKDEREEALQNMFNQVEFEMKREEEYKSSLKKLENELKAQEAKP